MIQWFYTCKLIRNACVTILARNNKPQKELSLKLDTDLYRNCQKEENLMLDYFYSYYPHTINASPYRLISPK